MTPERMVGAWPSPFTPTPVCPTLKILAVYSESGVIRRLWVWPWQTSTTADRAGHEPPSKYAAWTGRIEAERRPRWR